MSILKLAQNEKFRGWLNKINEIIDAVNKNASDLLDKASKKHTSTTTDYGVGNATEYGHIKLSDAIDDISNNTKGISATPLAVKTAYDKAQSAFSLAESINIANDNNGTVITQLQTDVVNKAPIKHSSNQQTYGIGNATEYGHVRLSIELDSIADTSSGVAVAPLAIKNINDSVIALTEVVDKKSPLNHASINDTYGVGDASSYGHVKLSDDVTLDKDVTNGIAASIGSVKATYDLANNANNNAQEALNSLQSKAPENHASESIFYGLGTDTTYGHVKVTDDVDLDASAITGIVPSSKALRETYLKALSAYNLATELKGTDTNTVFLSTEYLNTVVNNGVYMSINASQTLNYPYTDNACISVLEVSNVEVSSGFVITKQRIYSNNAFYIRDSYDGGNSWNDWILVSKNNSNTQINLYVSIEFGDDDESGLSPTSPIKSVNRLLELINIHSLFASNERDKKNIIIYFDSGEYKEPIILADLPATIQISSYYYDENKSDSIENKPHFSELYILRSRVSLSGLKIDYLYAHENSTIIIESNDYMSLGYIESTTESIIYISSLYIFNDAEMYPLHIHNTLSEDSIFCAFDYGRIYNTRNRELIFEENLEKSYIFECSYSGEIILPNIIFPEVETEYNFGQYSLTTNGSLTHPEILIGDPTNNHLEQNTTLQGVLYGGGSTAQYLRADGTWETPPDTKYTLPAATSSDLGGVTVGSNITNTNGTISLTNDNVTAALGYTPPQQDTTYSAGTGISISSGKISNSGVTSVNGKTGDVNIASGGMSTREIFTSSGTFTTPKDGVYTFMMLSGGQGGRNAPADGEAGAGGNAGKLLWISLYLKNGTECAITVGAGGGSSSDGGESKVTANSFTYTTLRGTVIAYGGRGASEDSNADSSAGENSSYGGTGGKKATSNVVEGGGGGGGMLIEGTTAPTASNGYGGYSSDCNGYGGYGWGAGGGGGGEPYKSATGTGGAGAQGIVIIYY